MLSRTTTSAVSTVSLLMDCCEPGLLQFGYILLNSAPFGSVRSGSVDLTGSGLQFCVYNLQIDAVILCECVDI